MRRCVHVAIAASLAVLAGCAYFESGGVSAAPPAAGGVPYILHEMAGEGSVEGTLARLRIRVDLTVLRSEWQTLPLFTIENSLSDVRVKRGDSSRVFVRRGDRAYELLIQGPGRFVVDLETLSRIREEENGKAMALPFLPALKSIFQVELPAPDLKVWTAPVTNTGTTTSGKKTNVFVYGGNAPEVILSWRETGPKTRQAPVVVAEQNTLVTVGRGSLREEVKYSFHVIQGTMNEILVETAPGLNLLDIRGTDIRAWNVTQEEKRQVLKVTLATEVAKNYELGLTLEQPIDAQVEKLELPVVQAQGVEREKGTIGISARKGVKVEPVEFRDAAQVDVQELSAIHAKLPDDLHLAFRYLKRPFTLKLRVGDVQPKVSADVFTLARVNRDALRLATTIHYKIREAGVFRFRIKLEPGLKLADLQGPGINNWQVGADDILTVDLRSKAEGEYRLCLEVEKLLKGAVLSDLPRLEALDVEREWGYVALVSAPGVKVEPGVADGIRQVNVTDLPGWVLEQAQEKSIVGDGKQPPAAAPGAAPAAAPAELPEFAYRYLKHPYSLKLSVSDIHPEVTVETLTFGTLDEKILTLSTQVRYGIQKAGIFALKLKVPTGLRLTAVEGPHVDDWVDKDGVLTVTLKTKVEGRYVLFLKAEQPVSEVTKGFAMPVISAVDVKKETGFVALKVDTAIRAKTEKMTRLSEIDLKDLPAELKGSEVTLAYKYLEQPWSLSLGAEKVKSRVVADSVHFVSIGEKQLAASVAIRYQVLYAGVSEFRVKLPKGVRHVDITGENIKVQSEQPKDDGNEWMVQLHAPKMGSYPLYLRFQQDIAPGDSTKVEYVGARALGVDQETGYVLVAARPDAETRIPDKGLTDLAPIDEREVPAAYKQGITVPILYAFRYLQPKYKMSLEVVQHGFAPVMVAVIEACRLLSTYTAEGNTITDIVMTVRNTREQYLSVLLPKDAMIYHLFVAGEEETPLSPDSRDAGAKKGFKEILIPISKVRRGDSAFEVRLRYGMTYADKLGLEGVLPLYTPQMSLSVLRLGWSVALPEKYQIVATSGNMEQVNAFEPMLAVLNPDLSLAPRVAPVHAEAPSAKPNVPSPVDNNEWAQENVRQRGGQDRAGVHGGRGAGMPSMYTGIQPRVGAYAHFQSLIPLDAIGSIKIRYIKTPAKGVVGGLLVALVVFASWLFWRSERLGAGAKIGALAALALCLFGLQVLLEGAYDELLRVLVLSFGGMAAIFAVMTGYDRFLGRVQPVDAIPEDEDSGEPPPPPAFRKPAEEPKPAEKPPEDPPANP